MKHTDLAYRLRRLREASGWSQAQLAARAGVSRVVIARIEAPGMQHVPTVAVLRKLAKALGVRVGDLIL
jgi:transcriptional regulator with XRE-family HTH domain